MIRKYSLFATFLAIFHIVNSQHLHLTQNAYIVGDTVKGVALFSNEKLINHSYYVSLFSTDGKRQVSELFLVKADYSSFWIKIPNDITSGRYTIQINNYQNNVPTHVKSILIINPSDLSTLDVIDNTIEGKQSSSLSFDFSSSGGKGSILFKPSEGLARAVKQIVVSITDDAQDVKILEKEQINQYETDCPLISKHKVSHGGLNDFLKGYHLSGRVLNKDGSAAVDVPIMINYFTDRLNLSYQLTNQYGEFVLYNLFQTGSLDVYLRVINKDEDSSYDIIIDDDPSERIEYFDDCSHPVEINSAKLNSIVRLMTLNDRVKKDYSSVSRVPVWAPQEPQPLLENPDELIDLDDYVSFSTAKKVIKETVPYVFFKKEKIRVFSPQQRKMLKGYPVLLINGVAASDEEVLNLSPDNIKYIEVINQLVKLYNYGGFALGGIVSIITKNGYEYGTEVTRAKITGYQHPVDLHSSNKSINIPHFPSLLHWDPSFEPDESGTYSFSFDLPDYPANLKLKATLQLKDGSIFNHKQIINLENVE